MDEAENLDILFTQKLLKEEEENEDPISCFVECDKMEILTFRPIEIQFNDDDFFSVYWQALLCRLLKFMRPLKWAKVAK